MSSDSVCKPNSLPIEEINFNTITTTKIALNVKIQEIGVNRLTRFQILGTSDGYLEKK